MKSTKKIRFRFVLSILLLGILTPLLFNVVHVKAQNSYIEVYAYDAYTLDPIAGANLYLYDETWMYLGDGFADITGFYNFTGLEPGNYFIEFSAPGYAFNQTFVTITNDGDGETIIFLAEPSFIPGDGYIELYVYDSITLDPVFDAYVELLSWDWEYITDDTTDALGFNNFTGLGPGDYWVVVDDPSYDTFEQLVTINYDGEGVSLIVYLDLPYTPGIGFIEVEVYGSDTLAPLAFADVALYNYHMKLITAATADASGYYNFTGLGPGEYVVEASYLGYLWNDTFVVIDYDGEGEYVLLYLPPEPTIGDGYIDVFVYDQSTYLPLENVELNLVTQYYVPIVIGMTDITGFYNFTYLGVDTYFLYAYLSGYETNETSVTIDFDGEGEYVELYLSPIVRSIEILSPTDSEAVEGGSVHVICDVSHLSDLSFYDIYVNDEYITRVYSFWNNVYQFIIPVFQNGTNEIEVVAFWYDASSANDSVTIDSVNVIPIVDIEEGDFCNYFVNITSSDLAFFIWNFTFVEWVTPFYMNTSVYMALGDKYGIDEEYEYYMEVNVLNGYVPYDPYDQFDQCHFFPFCTLQPDADIGDIAPVYQLHDLATVTGSMTWNYTDVWYMEVFETDTYIMCSEIDTNIVYYLSRPGDFEIMLVDTSIDIIIPYVSDEIDFEYLEGTTGNTISWDVSDMNPSHYYIYRDSVEIDSGDFDSGVISIDVDGLAVGSYIYQIIIYDFAGNSAEDTLTVTVVAEISEFSSLTFLLPISSLMVICYILVFKRKNK